MDSHLKKTDKVVVKILPKTQAIFDLYSDRKAMPCVISNQKFNDALKEIIKVSLTRTSRLK